LVLRGAGDYAVINVKTHRHLITRGRALGGDQQCTRGDASQQSSFMFQGASFEIVCITKHGVFTINLMTHRILFVTPPI
jgi:hypothetical protein